MDDGESHTASGSSLPLIGSPLRTTRRRFVAGTVGAVGAGLLVASQAPAGAAAQSATPPASPVASPASAGQAKTIVTTYPRPGTRTASPWTELTFRGVPPDALGTIKVIGSASGWHTGIIEPHADGQGGSYLTNVPFEPGEQITVTTGLNIRDGAAGVFSFTVSRPATPPVESNDRTTTDRAGMRTFHTRPDFLVPTFTLAPGSDPNATAPGYIFLAVTTTASQDSVIIVDNQGEPIWYLPMTLGVLQPFDFRAQTYQGKPVVTWWQGLVASGHGLGNGVIYDQSYRQVAAVRVGNGYAGVDLHEFLITPQNTALITIYNRVIWDLTAIGGTTQSAVTDGIVQEIELATGRVLFEWHSLDHIALDETYFAYTTKVESTDYFHINSIQLLPDSTLIISARNTWAIYQIDHLTGDVMWRLGGKKSDFNMGPNTEPAYQHDARLHPNGDLTLFDNGGVPQVHPTSRGLILHPDLTKKTATLVREYTPPSAMMSGAKGNMQLLPNGNYLVGWGSQPYFTEYRADGTVVYNVQMTGESYRAYRLPWTGRPAEPPAAVALPGANGGMTVYASWNGATDVASWEVMAGSSAGQLPSVASAPRDGFETTIEVSKVAPFVAVRAKDKNGDVLGTSPVVSFKRGILGSPATPQASVAGAGHL